MDSCCVMRSLNAESGRSGDTTNIIASPRVQGNPEWTDDQCVILNFIMGDINQNQFQTQQTHDVANEAIAEQVVAQNIASQLHNNNVHSMSKGERRNEKN